jgi:hypothetical protein
MKDFKLDNEPKITPGFTFPEGYFDSFAEKVLTQLPKEEAKVISMTTSKKKWYFAVAAILIAMLSIPIYNNLSTKQDEIDTDTLENYLAYHSTITEDEIVNLLDLEDLERMKVELTIDDAYIEEILKSNTNLEEYLIN